jgi:hypothetical protein
MTDVAAWMPLAFFAIALVYSSVGFAGGSAYLAVLLLAGLPYNEIKPIALFCNLAVSGVAFRNFYKAGYFDAKKVLPFAVLSVPMAFLGSKIPVGREVFTVLLGASLALAGLRILYIRKDEGEKRPLSPRLAWAYGAPMGAVIGFFSGLIGIGGGIFLSPILILTRRAGVKEASAAAAFFIFVNSLSGFLGRLPGGLSWGADIMTLGTAAFLGGIMGSALGARRFEERSLQRVLGALALFVSTRLVMGAF